MLSIDNGYNQLTGSERLEQLQPLTQLQLLNLFLNYRSDIAKRKPANRICRDFGGRLIDELSTDELIDCIMNHEAGCGLIY